MWNRVIVGFPLFWRCSYLHFCLLFHTATKVLIIGGEFDSEIFCPDSKDQCNAEYGNLNQETWYPVGGVLGSKVIICGGEQLVKTLLPFQLEKSDSSLLIWNEKTIK